MAGLIEAVGRLDDRQRLRLHHHIRNRLDGNEETNHDDATQASRRRPR